MGKEFKIGLSVIGVLLVVFGVLLARRLSGSGMPATGGDEAVAHDTGSPPTSGKPDKAQVIPQNNPLGASQAAWNGDAPAGRDAEPPADGPHPVYMPSSGGEGDRYADFRSRQAAADEPAEAQAAPGANPFGRRATVPSNDEPADAPAESKPVTPRRLDEAEREPSAMNPVGRGPRPLRNPIRRASAEEPIQDQPQDDPQSAPRDVAAPRDFSVDQDVASGTDTAIEEAPVTLSQQDDRQPIVEEPQPAAEPQSTVPAQWQSSGPAERPVADAEPQVPANGKYTVQPNDTLWAISEKVYGTGRYFKAIYAHNRSILPRADQLAVGTVIAVPPAATLEQNFPALCPKQRKSVLVKPRTLPASTGGARGENEYVVEEGDTLFDIARHELGKASRWAEIYELNRNVLGDDFDYLQPGTPLTLPPRGGADAVTRQGSPGYQR